MMYIGVRVEEEISTGNQIVHFDIPASLVPVIHYQLKINDGEELEIGSSISVKTNNAKPIRLLYETGLKSEIHGINVNEKVASIVDDLSF